MHRKRSQISVDKSSVSTSRFIKTLLLLQAEAARRIRTKTHEPSRRNLYSSAFLWIKKDNRYFKKRGLSNKSKTNSGHNEMSRFRRNGPRPKYFKKQSKSCEISLSIGGEENRKDLTGMELGHNLYPAVSRICLSHSNNRLAQSSRSIKPTVKQSGRFFLPRRSGRSGRNVRVPRDFQHRPGNAIYLLGICGGSIIQGNAIQHGWEGKSVGQYLHREIMEIIEV